MRYYNTIYSFILEYKNPNVAFYLRDFTTHVMSILDRKSPNISIERLAKNWSAERYIRALKLS